MADSFSMFVGMLPLVAFEICNRRIHFSVSSGNKCKRFPINVRRFYS